MRGSAGGIASPNQGLAPGLAVNDPGTRYLGRYMLGGSPIVAVEQTVSAAGCIDYLNSRAFVTYEDGSSPPSATYANTTASVELQLGTSSDDIVAMLGPVTHYEQGGTQTMRITGVFGSHTDDQVREMGPTDWDSTVGTSTNTANGIVLRRDGTGVISVLL